MRNKRLIVADGKSVITLCLKSLLAAEGYDVEAADTSERALSLARDGHADLLLVDAEMPAESGYCICQRLRADPATRDLPIVVMSARPRRIETEKALALGADAMIGKPFTLKELKHTLALALTSGNGRAEPPHA